MTVLPEKTHFQERCPTDGKQRFEKNTGEKHIRKWEATLESNHNAKSLMISGLVEMGFSEKAARRVLHLPDTDTVREK